MRRGLTWIAAAVLVMGGAAGARGEEAGYVSNPGCVICASPAVAEIVFALGCGGRVAGVSDFTDWPPEAAAKPRIGGVLSPNRERILALAPEMILAQGQSEALAGFAQAYGIAFHTFPLETLKDVRAAITGLAAVLGVENAGQALLARMEAEFADLPACGPVPVFLALNHAPGDFSGLMTCGGGTFLDELVTRAGGQNIFSDVPGGWPRISRETLIRRNPGLIVDVQAGPVDDERRGALLSDWERLGFRREQIRILTEEYLLRPGPRAPQSAARLSAVICEETSASALKN